MLAEGPEDYSRLLIDNQGLIERIVRAVGRRRRLSADDTEELLAAVYVKLIDRDFAVLRAYRGRSTLTTYLTTVVSRVYLDEQTARWGRWRPSTAARRLGPTAVLLEQLLVRDGMSFDQACRVIRMNHGVRASDAELDRLHEVLPLQARRRLVSLDTLIHDVAAPEPEPSPADDRVYDCLSESLAALPAADRELLHLKFAEGWTIRRIADRHGLSIRPTYRRFERLLGQLQHTLRAAKAESRTPVVLR